MLIGDIKKSVNLYWRKEVKHILQSRKFTDKERMIFYKQLAIILHSGLPLLNGIQIMNQRVNKKLRTICNSLYKDLTRGYSLEASMRRQKHFFHDLGVMLISAGEESGRLEEVALELADYYEKQSELKNFIFKATLYPMFLLAASIAVLIFFMFYVLPVLATAYSSMQVKPQGLLAILLSSQVFISTHLSLIICISVMAIVALLQLRMKILELLKQLPVLGKIYYLILEIRFCKLMTLLLNSGVGVIQAITITQRVIKDEKCHRKLLLFQSRLQKGSEIAAAINSLAGWLSPLSLDLIIMGATTGSLPQMLCEAVAIREQDLQNSLNSLKEALSPLMLLFAAIITVGVVTSVVGPLFNLISALPENN